MKQMILKTNRSRLISAQAGNNASIGHALSQWLTFLPAWCVPVAECFSRNTSRSRRQLLAIYPLIGHGARKEDHGRHKKRDKKGGHAKRGRAEADQRVAGPSNSGGNKSCMTLPGGDRQ